MSVRYQIHPNDAFLTDAFQRHHSQHSLYRVFAVIRIIGIVVLMLCSLALVVAGEWSMAILTLGMASFIPLSRKFDHFCRARTIKKLPFWNEVSVTEFSDEGLKSNSSNGSSDLSWQAFTRVLRFPDGFLLYQGPSYFHWLPDSSLVEGFKAQDAEVFLRKHLADYQVIRT